MTIGFLKQIIASRRSAFILLAVLALVNLGLYGYLSAYQEPRLTALHNQWFEKRRTARGGALQDAASIYKQGSADLAAWRARISPKKDFARLVGELFEIAANNSLKVGAVVYKPALVKDENLLAYAISFNVSGKYAAIKSFIADLGRSREMMTIDTITLNNTKATEEAVDLRLQVTAYFRTEGQ